MLVVLATFVSVSAVSASTTDVKMVEHENFEDAQELSSAEPQYLPALAAIGQAARVAQAGVKAAKAVGKAVAVGFAAAAGADAYSKITGIGAKSSDVPQDSELAFD
ncbi:hypothetical protein RCG24_18975 [Neobacillus sp. OS1-32]|uniref:Uncharacterized protein n=1 Tax=Neobacillus paridis TaxID=2803862 RepID=A0ABS1TKJ1_9BACI|nr:MULTISPECIES: hypothetical protein [Neobacillus]MBL4951834.1 hypothetical protein [Neobacillus paridis]WML29962.1 hypothetical protein RCG24_18975 [Neobacillus sp. OS1-32]